MKCIHCGKKENLWAVELYKKYFTKTIYCCKGNNKCKKKLWNFSEENVKRQNKIDFDNGIDVWKTLFPNEPIPNTLLKTF